MQEAPRPPIHPRPNVRQLEARWPSSASAICRRVGNGTDALHLALRALRIGPGDEVITTPFTSWLPRGHRHRRCHTGLRGHRPADVQPRPIVDGSGDHARTRAVLPCICTDNRATWTRSSKSPVDIDCASSKTVPKPWAHRTRAGDRFPGRCGCLSFFPAKPGCFGDGGMVVTNDPQLAERVEMLRRHGGKVKYYHDELGSTAGWTSCRRPSCASSCPT